MQSAQKFQLCLSIKGFFLGIEYILWKWVSIVFTEDQERGLYWTQWDMDDVDTVLRKSTLILKAT